MTFRSLALYITHGPNVESTLKEINLPIIRINKPCFYVRNLAVAKNANHLTTPFYLSTLIKVVVQDLIPELHVQVLVPFLHAKRLYQPPYF